MGFVLPYSYKGESKRAPALPHEVPGGCLQCPGPGRDAQGPPAPCHLWTPTWEAAKWEVSPNFPNCPHFLPQERNQHGAGLASCFSARGWALLGGVLEMGAARAEQAAIPLLPRGVLEHFFLNRDLTSGVFPFFLVFLLECLMLIYC